MNPTPGEIPSRITACCFWTSCPSSSAACWRRCASHSRRTRHHLPGGRHDDVSVAIHAGGGDESDAGWADAGRVAQFTAGNPELSRADFRPLLDRIDLHVEVPAVKFREITAERTGETSAQIRERVVAARRKHGQQRFAAKAKITCNAAWAAKNSKAFCALDETTLELLKQAMGEMNLSAALMTGS